MSASELEIRAEGVSKSFDDVPVLRSVDLEARRGGILAIVGGSGSGKTVLLHLLAGLMQPTGGRVLAADHSRAGSPLVDLATLSGDEIEKVRMFWGFVFQRNALFSGSVHDNIALLLRERGGLSEHQISERVRSSLASVALEPDEVDAKDRDELSGGMAKRVAIARALAIHPAVIFYDEPTTGLDPVLAAHIHELIWNTHRNKNDSGVTRTSIIVTHDKELLRRLRPTVIMLFEGGVCFSGEYDDFEQVRSGPPAEYLRAMPVLHATKRR